MYRLETRRLLLRTWQTQDAEALFNINQDPKVMAFFPSLQDRTTTQAFIARMQTQFAQRGYCLYAVERKDTQEFIGFTGLSYTDFPADFTPATEMGWRIGHQHWGYGYATEAATAVLHEAFYQHNLDCIVSFTTVHNQRSRRVMEKIGLVYQAGQDFNHPYVPADSPLVRHVLYRKQKL